MSEGIVQRRRKIQEEPAADRSDENADSAASSEQEDNDKGTRLTLMEQILLLGLKDREASSHTLSLSIFHIFRQNF
ncbi:hypothetical protein Q1695_009674 [Nippostrongylus brasiliensis]|nr:hypothetical protein Q1695_009674 [Nippostrongylus brasiliensis]